MKRAVLVLITLCAAACRKTDATPQQGPAGRVVPVMAAQVARRDIPIWLEGLGTVTAYKTVQVRSQVDGRLDSLFFREGQPVKRGDAVAQIDPRPFQIQLQQAEGALARDQALLKSAKLNLKRNQDLLARKLIAPQAVDDQAAQVGQYEGAVRIDESQANAARLNLAYARITSPIDGVTGIRNVDPGNFVRAADPNGIVVITQLDPMAVIFTLPEDELPQIAQAMKSGPLDVEVFGREGGLKLGAGRLELVDNQINQQTATLRLKAVFPNPDRVLWPNEFVKARVKVAVRPGALVVPTTSLQRGPDGSFVYAINADQTVAPRPVKVDLQQGDLTLLAGGLEPGEQVVTEGMSGLRPGAKVQVQQPGQQQRGPARNEGQQPQGTQQPQGRK